MTNPIDTGQAGAAAAASSPQEPFKAATTHGPSADAPPGRGRQSSSSSTATPVVTPLDFRPPPNGPPRTAFDTIAKIAIGVGLGASAIIITSTYAPGALPIASAALPAIGALGLLMSLTQHMVSDHCLGNNQSIQGTFLPKQICGAVLLPVGSALLGASTSALAVKMSVLTIASTATSLVLPLLLGSTSVITLLSILALRSRVRTLDDDTVCTMYIKQLEQRKTTHTQKFQELSQRNPALLPGEEQQQLNARISEVQRSIANLDEKIEQLKDRSPEIVQEAKHKIEHSIIQVGVLFARQKFGLSLLSTSMFVGGGASFLYGSAYCLTGAAMMVSVPTLPIIASVGGLLTITGILLVRSNSPETATVTSAVEDSLTS